MDVICQNMEFEDNDEYKSFNFQQLLELVKVLKHKNK